MHYTITGQLTVDGPTLQGMLATATAAVDQLLVGAGERTDLTIRLDGLRRQSATTGWVATAVFTAHLSPVTDPAAPEPAPEVEPATTSEEL